MATKFPRIRLTLTDAEHDRMNRFRNNVSVWMGYGMILLLGCAGLMLFLGLAVRAARWAI